MAIEYKSVSDLVTALGKLPLQLRSELRPELRAGGQVVLNEMKARASYSSRIPGAITMRVSFTASGGGIRFKVNSTKAPHARPLEGLTTRGNTFRHPVFPDGPRSEWNWAPQQTRPFFFPGLDAKKADLRDRIQAAVINAQRKALT